MESVEDYMTRNHPFCLRTDTIQKVSQKMVEHNTSEIIVVDSEAALHPLGVVYERDINNCCIAQGKDPRVRTSADCMKKVSVLIDITMSPEQSFDIMEKNHVSRAPVVNERDQFCGFVNRDDLAEVFSD